jgi:type VI secretion system protein ImpJ
MPRLQPIIWSKGTSLTQQHLQMQDVFLESSLHFRLNALQFRPWGFHALQVDREALAAGTFLLNSASGIFPDGLLFDIPRSDAAPPPKLLTDCFPPDQNELDVYLAIPPWRDGGLNIAAPRVGADTRYTPQVTMLRDENTGLSEKPVMIARKNFRFLTQSELQQGTIAMRVARVKRSEAGVCSLDTTFVPPLLDFHVSDYLVTIARRLSEMLFARSTQLSDIRRQKNQSLADFSASDIADFWLLYTVNSYAPLINHLYLAGVRHPERLFEAMSALAGSLTTFSTTLHPRDIPPYDHDNLSLCFTNLDEKLRILLETNVPTNWVSLPLKLVRPYIWATDLAEDKYLKSTQMYLAMSTESSQSDTIDRAPSLVKVCSASHIDHLITHAIPGMELTYVATPPNAIPIKLKYTYFILSQTGPAWEAVRRARNFAAHVPGDLPNPQLELLILLPQSGSGSQ